jgi:hypothetical protein
VERLGKQGAGFQGLTDGLDTTTHGGKLVLHIMEALGEVEHDLIHHTQADMKATRNGISMSEGQRPYHWGRCSICGSCCSRQDTARSGGTARGLSQYGEQGAKISHRFASVHEPIACLRA